MTCADDPGDTGPSASAARRAISLLLGLWYRGEEPPESTAAEFADCPELARLLQDVSEAQAFARALAQGDLSSHLLGRGTMAGSLKSLHASLRHLTWQTRAVADGDFTQRVEFMGEFASSFNAMVCRLAEMHEALSDLAVRDPLTGLHNRRFLDEMLPAELGRAARSGARTSVLLADVDHFKRVNDTYGHARGDQVLQELAALLRATSRASDLCCRYGGEEFVVVLSGADTDVGRARAETIRDRFAARVLAVNGQQLSCTCSIGVATCPWDGETADLLLEAADRALYAAKAGGRNRVVSARQIGGADR